MSHSVCISAYLHLHKHTLIALFVILCAHMLKPSNWPAAKRLILGISSLSLLAKNFKILAFKLCLFHKQRTLLRPFNFTKIYHLYLKQSDISRYHHFHHMALFTSLPEQNVIMVTTRGSKGLNYTIFRYYHTSLSINQIAN